MTARGGAPRTWKYGADGAPDLVGRPDQGLRLNRRLRRRWGANPAFASYRFRALKVPLSNHGIVNDGCDGRCATGGTGERRCGVRRQASFGKAT